MGKDLDILQAVKDNDFNGLQKLLQKAAKQAKNKIIGNKRLNINFQDGDGMSALHQAALMSSAPMLRTLLENGAAPGLRDNKGMIALHYATWQGVPQSVQILLQKGSPVNEQALNGETPLHLACQHGHLEVATLLLNQHADPTICNKELKTSLDLACEFGRTRIVELLLRSNLCQKLLEDSPTDTLDNNRTTCLHLAARGGHVDIIKLLLQAGMNINRSTLKGTCLHEAALACRMEAVKLLLDCGVDVNKPDSYDQTALDIVTKFTSGHAGKELKHILKEASCAVYARATKDYSNVYDPGSLAFKEGDIITVLEQKADGIWRGYVFHEGRMAKTGMFPANHVVLVDSKALARQQQQQQHQQHLQKLNTKSGHMFGPVPDLLNRGPPVFGTVNAPVTIHSSYHSGGGSDRGSLESSSTEDSQPTTPHSFPSTPSSCYPPPPPASLITSYPPRSPLTRDPSCADSGFSSSQSLPQNTPSSPAAPQQFGKSPFAFGPTVIAANVGSGQHYYPSSGNANGGSIPDYQPQQQQQQQQPHHIQQHHHHHHHHQQQLQQQQHGEWTPAPTSLPALGGVGADMRGASPAKDSPGHSNRNSAASSDSGRGYSTGHTDAKPTHNYINVHVNNQQHRLSGQSYESGVSSRQSYHSTSSSSLGSLDRLEEPGYTSTINVLQLFQAGVPDNEVLHAWLHELGFVEYYPLFYQAGYDMPTISRMTPEDLTAIGITKPAHRKRLKSEIARLNIHDGIPDYKPNDLMEWLHLLGLGTYLDTLCGQGYDNIDYVTDITWEDLEEIGIQKLGHQKKIMLAIDRLKRITSGGKRLSSVDGRTASLELLEPPPPAPPITGRWSGGEITAISQHIYDGALGGACPKKSPSGDSISTTSSGNSGSSVGSAGGGPGHAIAAAQGEVRVIPLPREDAGLAGATPYRHNSTGASSGLQPDVVAIQVKRNMRSSTSEDKRDTNGQPLMYHSFQGPTRRSSENDVFVDSPGRVLDADDFATYQVALDKRKPISKAMVKSESEKHESEINSDGNKSMYYTATNIKHNHNNNSTVRVDAGEHIYDTPQIIQSQTSTNPMNVSLSGSLHINTDSDCSLPGQSKPVSPGSKGAKKIPPPPPKRTHSIREETTPLSQSAPASPSRNLTAPTTITVSASVHPQPVAIVAKQPPPVMQKPQKPHSPAVANKFHPQTQYVAPLPQQQQQLPQHYHQQPQVSLNPPAVAQKPLSPKPSTGPILIVAAPANSTLQAAHGHSSPHQPAGFAKPKVSIIQPQVQQPAQPKSPLPSKSPMAATNVPKPLHAQQQQQPPYTSSAHVHAGPHAMSQQPPSPHPVQIAQTGQPQVQAFASCVKSLSEKFGKKTDEEDQFPDNVSTDSDDFPPPPPPIAMDIITPKIHNYGIPSIRGKSDFGIHQRDYGNKARPNQQGPRNFIAPGSAVTGHPRHAGNVMPVMPTPKPSPNLSPAVVGEVQLRKNANSLSVTGSSPSSSEHECTPEPDSVKLIGHDKRSESTTSFESNSSSSSIDSNTLPFANENVGTIKQRAANSKPSIVQSMEAEGGQRNVDLNPGVFDNESHRYSNSAPYKSSPSSYSQHIVAGEQTRAPGFNGNMLSPQMQNKLSKQPPSGAIRAAPVPNSKPMLSPKPSRPASGPSESLPPPPPPASTEDSQKPVSSGNVLSDIDDMLQGLTDELDAMLEQEMNSS